MSATRGKSVLDDCQPLAEKRDRRLVSRVSARLSQVPDFDLEVCFRCSTDLCGTDLADVRFLR
jgi:hypothetical protein